MNLKKNNKIPLDKFIDICLYDKKKGYYINRNPFGQNGDFTTAPNISRLFSEMISIWIISYWQNLGSPKKFNLIELGAGNGEMMKIIIETFKRFPNFYNSCNIFIHEKSPNLIREQKKKIKNRNILWIENFKKIKNFPSLFLANEFFDSLPIKQFLKKKNLWFEKFVDISDIKKNKFLDKKVNINPIEKKLGFKFSTNQNFIEYSPTGFKYLKNIIKIINKHNGGLLIIDYGYNSKKMKNTLQSIYKKRFSNVLENIGKSDITYNINFNLIKNFLKKYKEINTKITTQRKFLINLGIQKRAEIISKNKTFSEKAEIYYRVKRLIDKKEMGNLFKVMFINKYSKNFNTGF